MILDVSSKPWVSETGAAKYGYPLRDRILKESHVPILLASTSLFLKNEIPLPHWVVVTGFQDGNWCLNNPLASSPHTRLCHEELQGNLGYRGVRCAVVICGRNHEF